MEALDPGAAAEPQVSLAILEERRHRSRGVGRRVRKLGGAPRVGTQQPRARAHPHVRVPVAEQGQRLHAAERLRHPVRRELGAVPAHDAAIGADPQLPIGERHQAVDLAVGQAGQQCVEAAVADAVEARVARAQEQRAVGRLGHRQDDRARDAREPDALEALAVAHEQAAHLRVHDELAVAAHGHRRDRHLARVGGERHALEAGVAVAQQRGLIGAQPEAAGLVHLDAENVWAAGRDGSRAAQQSELRAVEADEAALGAEPEVAVLALCDRVDAAAREAVFGAPARPLVQPQGSSRIERVGRGGRRQADEQQPGPRAPGAHGRYSNDWTITSVGSGSVSGGLPKT